MFFDIEKMLNLYIAIRSGSLSRVFMNFVFKNKNVRLSSIKIKKLWDLVWSVMELYAFIKWSWLLGYPIWRKNPEFREGESNLRRGTTFLVSPLDKTLFYAERNYRIYRKIIFTTSCKSLWILLNIFNINVDILL